MGDPFAAIADIIVGWHKAGQLEGWLKLLFSVSYSFVISFCTASGASLVAGGSGKASLGYGLLSGAAMSFVSFQNASSKLTKGITVVVPQETITDRNTVNGQGPMISQSKQ